MINNDYYDIAHNDYLYLMSSIDSPYYNNICACAQQVAEKLLKSVAELVVDDMPPNLLNTYNLRILYDNIKRKVPDFNLDHSKLSMLKDMYFNTRYPGDNFITATKENSEECLETLHSVVEEVNRFRGCNGETVLDFSIRKTDFRSELEKVLPVRCVEECISLTPKSMQKVSNIQEVVDLYMRMKGI